jgi:hypothetical protein
MTRAGTTVYFGDIGDNAEKRPQVTVYAVPEPGAGAAGGPVTPSATHVLRYPDGSHNAESLLVDPTTGRLAVVTKTDGGLGTVYRAPESGQGTMEKIADLAPPPDAEGLSRKAAILATGADAIAGRLVVRTYIGGFEWDLPEGEDLATSLTRPPVQVALPLTVQGEAVAYTRDGTGLLVTSEGDGGPVHRLAPAGAEGPGGTTTTTAADTGDDDGGDATVSWAPLAGVGVAAVILSVVFRRNRNRPD